MSKQKKRRNENMRKLYYSSQHTDKPLSFDAIGRRYRISGERARVIIRELDEKNRLRNI